MEHDIQTFEQARTAVAGKFSPARAEHSVIEELAYLLMAPNYAFNEGLQSFIGMLEKDFTTEETLMERIDFPESKAHRQQHATILAALHGVVSEALGGNHEPAHAVLEALPQWMLYHLIKMDAQFFAAVDRAGLKSLLPARLAPEPEFFNRLGELDRVCEH